MSQPIKLKISINTSFDHIICPDIMDWNNSDSIDKYLIINTEVRSFLESHISELINKCTIEIVDEDNILFANLGPLSGDALKALIHCINKVGKKSPTMPNRL